MQFSVTCVGEMSLDLRCLLTWDTIVTTAHKDASVLLQGHLSHSYNTEWLTSKY